ncbi:MAG: ATP-binding protein, partial [Planctomycetes bacterium]|nr:ATP-binding protein [Planctomycetota bacterium]
LTDDSARDPWDGAETLEASPELEREPFGEASFDDLPSAATQPASYKAWSKKLVDTLYREQSLTLRKCKLLDATSLPGESEGDFRARLSQRARELRDEKVEQLRAKYAPKLERLEDRIRDQERRVEKEEAQYSDRKLDTAVSIGRTILGALFGRKVASAGNVGRAATSVRSASRAAKEKADIAHAEDKLEDLKKDLEELETEFQDATRELEQELRVEALELDEKTVRPKKSEIDVSRVNLVWLPFRRHEDGRLESLR